LVLGAELGSRGMRVVAADRTGQILDSVHGILPRTTALTAVDSLCLLIEQMLARPGVDASQVAGIGVAFGGPVDAERGTTISSSRIPGFEQLPLVGVMEDRFKLPVTLENDARAAALGEYRLGAGRGAHTMIYLQLGIGVGGGIVLDGRLLHGSTMTAGEFGHMPVTADGPRCSCGKPGHLEAYVSESAVLNRMRERLWLAEPQIAEAWQASGGVSIRRIFERATEDEDAREVVDLTTRMVGLALAALVTALNSDAVVLGGYARDLGDRFIGSVRARIRQYAFDSAAQRLTVSLGQLGDDAAVHGAIALTMDMLRRAA
jgi:glucokinase